MLSILTAAVLLGIASTPHCVVMCGPLASYAGCSQGRGAGYHGARLAMLLVLGGLAGAFGELVVLQLDATLAQDILSLAIAAALAMGAYRLFREASLRQAQEAKLVQLRLPGKTAKRSWLRALSVGGATPLLPCGALWGALMLSVGTGSSWQGALAMLAFFVPTALALQLSSRAARALASRGPGAQRTFATLLALGAIVTALRPLDGLRQVCMP